MSKHRAGGKFTGSHGSIIEAAEAPVDAAARLFEVSKIALGRIERVVVKKQRLKFKETPAGLEVAVYGQACVQTIHVYTTDREKVIRIMTAAF